MDVTWEGIFSEVGIKPMRYPSEIKCSMGIPSLANLSGES